jgi:zinc protease
MTWPTRDDSDFDEELKLELLERVMRLELLDTLREKLGQTTRPASRQPVRRLSRLRHVHDQRRGRHRPGRRRARGDARDRRALIAAPVDDDELLRARQPLLEAYDNALKTNSGWMTLVERAQRKPERIGRFTSGKDRLAALTPEDVRAVAAQYLVPAQGLEIDALPRPAAGTN